MPIDFPVSPQNSAISNKYAWNKKAFKLFGVEK